MVVDVLSPFFLYLEYLKVTSEILVAGKVIAEHRKVSAGFLPSVTQAVVAEAGDARSGAEVDGAVAADPGEIAQTNTWTVDGGHQLVNTLPRTLYLSCRPRCRCSR